MRTLRSLAALGALVVLAPAAASAQAVDKDFTNSWFWGAKGGAMVFWTTDVSHAPAPLFGAEWLITRKHAALNVALDQAIFDETSTFREYDYNGNDLGTEGRARIQNMRRFSAQVFAFPKKFGPLRPYAGGGFALNMIKNATVVTTDPAADAESSIEQVKTRGSAIFTGGAQLQLGPLAVFGQASAMPARNNFFLNNNTTYFFEGGLRYRLASSVSGRR